MRIVLKRQGGHYGRVNIWKGKEAGGGKGCGDVKVVTTYLEMHSRDELHPKGCEDPRFEVREVTPPQWEFNRMMYELVGELWDWWDKQFWDEQRWREYAETPALRTFGAYYKDEPAGYFELKKHEDGSVQIAYFGLSPGFIGRGFGGALLTRAIAEGWGMEATRVWVHTCTKDHPAALQNYQARGLKIYKQV